MLELSADDDVFTFKHDGKEYTIPSLTIDDVEVVSEMVAKPHREMTALTRDYLLGKVDEDTATVIRSVSLKSYFRIFRAWAGMDLGESRPSDES